MDNFVHKYYCAYCKRYMSGDNPSSLAIGVNTHTTLFHPALFSNWSAAGIVLSAQYSRPQGDLNQTVLQIPQHTAPSFREWGDASEPTITDQDRALLAGGLVKW
jgi:hypothetical protein